MAPSRSTLSPPAQRYLPAYIILYLLNGPQSEPWDGKVNRSYIGLVGGQIRFARSATGYVQETSASLLAPVAGLAKFAADAAWHRARHFFCTTILRGHVTKLSKVADAIIADIESGALREGDQLPSEGKLAANYKVSVGTVQKALARLANTGIISREHGRGTFVSRSTISPGDLRYLRFRDAEGSILPSYVHVRSVRRTKQRGPWSAFLGGREFVRIERSINIGRHLELYSEFWLRNDDFARLGGVNRQTLEKNLRMLLGAKLALPTVRADQWIHFMPLPPKPARILGLRSAKSGFVMELRGYTLRDRALYYQCIYAGPFSEKLVISG